MPWRLNVGGGLPAPNGLLAFKNHRCESGKAWTVSPRAIPKYREDSNHLVRIEGPDFDTGVRIRRLGIPPPANPAEAMRLGNPDGLVLPPPPPGGPTSAPFRPLGRPRLTYGRWTKDARKAIQGVTWVDGAPDLPEPIPMAPADGSGI